MNKLLNKFHVQTPAALRALKEKVLACFYNI